jgi:hypothetical protein
MSFSSSVSLVFVKFYTPFVWKQLGLYHVYEHQATFPYFIHPQILNTRRTYRPNMSLSPVPSSSILQRLAAHYVFQELKNIGIQIMLYTSWANAMFQMY